MAAALQQQRKDTFKKRSIFNVANRLSYLNRIKMCAVYIQY